MQDSSPSAPPRPMGLGLSVAWTLALWVVLVTLHTIVGRFRPSAVHDEVNFTLLYAASALSVIFGIATVHGGSSSLSTLLGAKPVGFWSAVVACLFGGALTLPLDALEIVLSQRFPLETARAAELTQAMSEFGRNARILGVFGSMLVQPVVETVFFQGALTTGLTRSRSPAVAAAAGAVLFGLFGSLGDLRFFPYYLAIGVAIAWVRWATSSLLTACGASACFHVVSTLREATVVGTLDPLSTMTRMAPAVPIGQLAASLGVLLLLGAAMWKLPRAGSELTGSD